MKHYAVILSLLLCFALLLGCGATQNESTDPNGPSQTEQQTPETTDPVKETTDPVEESTDPVEETEEPEEPTETEEPEPIIDEEPVPEHPMEVLPVNEKIELTDPMADGTYHVAFSAEDIMNVGDTFFLTAEFFDYDRYDAAVVEDLQVGDTIEVCGETITVDSVEFLRDEGTDAIHVINVNGGMDFGGVSLMSNSDKTVYRTFTWNNFPVYYSVGEMGCVISHDIVLTDQRYDPSDEPEAADFQALPGWVSDWVAGYFSELSTTLTMENGEATRIDRSYMP